MLSRALRRLEKESEKISQHYSDQLNYHKIQDLVWIVDFQGPADSLYQGEQFRLRFTFSQKYPIESPQVVFVGTPPVHQHIYSNGYICLSILYNSWNPGQTVASVTLSIKSMLSTAKKKKRPKDNRDVVKESKGVSPKDISWNFHDEKCQVIQGNQVD